jgi:hypothetical protein
MNGRCFAYVFCLQPTELSHQAMVLFTTEEMQMQVKKTGLFEDVDFHNDNLVAELESLIASEMFTAFEILEFAEEIVAKRKQADAGMLDLRTGLRY